MAKRDRKIEGRGEKWRREILGTLASLANPVAVTRAGNSDALSVLRASHRTHCVNRYLKEEMMRRRGRGMRRR